MQYRLVCEQEGKLERLAERYLDSIEAGPRACDEGVTVVSRSQLVIEGPEGHRVYGFGPLQCVPV